MPEKNLNVALLQYTPAPADTIALAGRLCYSGSDIASLHDKSRGTADEFVDKLLNLGHLSPIEHASFTFGVEGVSRALLAQITRHRIASFSVQSQRYVKQTEMNYIIPKSICDSGEKEVEEFKRQMETIHAFYNSWLDKGIPAEDARFVLPNAAETKMIITMNARELLHFLELRCCNRAQWEIRALAWVMLGMARREAPSLFARVGGPACVSRGACPEGRMSCKRAKEVKEFSDRLTEMCKEASDEEILEFVKSNMR